MWLSVNRASETTTAARAVSWMSRRRLVVVVRWWLLVVCGGVDVNWKWGAGGVWVEVVEAVEAEAEAMLGEMGARDGLDVEAWRSSRAKADGTGGSGMDVERVGVGRKEERDSSRIERVGDWYGGLWVGLWKSRRGEDGRSESSVEGLHRQKEAGSVGLNWECGRGVGMRGGHNRAQCAANCDDRPCRSRNSADMAELCRITEAKRGCELLSSERVALLCDRNHMLCQAITTAPVFRE